VIGAAMVLLVNKPQVLIVLCAAPAITPTAIIAVTLHERRRK
jgi:hypothetical protein